MIEQRQHYQEIPADTLVDLGVIDTLRKPVNGESRLPLHIDWSAATLAVAAYYTYRTDRGVVPEHEIILKTPQLQGITFLTTIEGDTVRVATVAGSEPEHQAELTPEQAAVFKELVRQSESAGPAA